MPKKILLSTCLIYTLLALPALADKGTFLYKLDASDGSTIDTEQYGGSNHVLGKRMIVNGSDIYVLSLFVGGDSSIAPTDSRIVHYEWSGSSIDYVSEVTLPGSRLAVDIGVRGDGGVITTNTPTDGNGGIELLRYLSDLTGPESTVEIAETVADGTGGAQRMCVADSTVATISTQVGNSVTTVISSTGIDTSGPYATSVGAIPFSELTSFADTDNADGDFEYQLSADGTNYYYFNGASWTLQTGNGWPSQTSPASEINSNLATFPDTGDLRVRAFLGSNGTQEPSLDTITVGYSVAAAPPAPGGGTVDRDIAIYRQRWIPKIPTPIQSRAISDSEIEWIFDTRLADDANDDNDSSGFYLYDKSGKRIGDSGINAVTKTKTFSIIEGGLKPNTYVSGRRVSGFNGAGESAWSVEFPPIYTLPKTPGIKAIDALEKQEGRL